MEYLEIVKYIVQLKTILFFYQRTYIAQNRNPFIQDMANQEKRFQHNFKRHPSEKLAYKHKIVTNNFYRILKRNCYEIFLLRADYIK